MINTESEAPLGFASFATNSFNKQGTKMNIDIIDIREGVFQTILQSIKIID
jgi:hypothetical protein